MSGHLILVLSPGGDGMVRGRSWPGLAGRPCHFRVHTNVAGTCAGKSQPIMPQGLATRRRPCQPLGRSWQERQPLTSPCSGSKSDQVRQIELAALVGRFCDRTEVIGISRLTAALTGPDIHECYMCDLAALLGGLAGPRRMKFPTVHSSIGRMRQTQFSRFLGIR